MYKPEHFIIQELVPRSVYEDRWWKAFELLDDRALITLDAIRSKFGPTIVNNWHSGGSREWSGLRTPASPYGSEYSQHRYGRAFDCLLPQSSAQEARKYILAHQDEFPHIRGLELGISWLHFETSNRRGSGIFTFYP